MTPKGLFINDAIAGWGGLSLPDKVRVLYEYKLKDCQKLPLVEPMD